MISNSYLVINFTLNFFVKEKLTLSWSVVIGMVCAWSVNMQWAAEMTYLEATRVPPQPSHWLPSGLTKVTIQGYLFF